MRPRNHWSPRSAMGSITTSSSIIRMPLVAASAHTPLRGPRPARARRNAAAARNACQAADGHWVGELEADRALTAEALLLRQLIDRVDRSVERRAVTYLRRRQNEDGGWSLFESGESDLSATIKIYFAMKLAGVSPEDPAMQRA